MTIRALSSRLVRLAGERLRPEDCRTGPTVILNPGEPVPDDASVCPRCGSPHVLVIHEVIVERGPDGVLRGTDCHTGETVPVDEETSHE